MSDEKVVEQDLIVWTRVLRMALEENNKEVAMYCIREIESVISNVCYVYDLWLVKKA